MCSRLSKGQEKGADLSLLLWRKGDRYIFPTLNLTGRARLEYRK